MYAQHFHLTHDPFSIAPDPRFLYMSDRHREALAHLLFGVQGTGGVVLLTGEIGTGKTTVCRCLLEQIPANCHVAVVFNPKLSVIELLQTVCEEFHISVKPTWTAVPGVKMYVDAINQFLLACHAQGRGSILIIDEAQNLNPDVLEQLRLLTNLETNERKLLQIMLIGQPELRIMLERPDLEQLAQRIVARFHLEALNETEMMAYIRHRLAVAGHAGPLMFDAQALQRIYRLSRGIPRRINLLCGRALLGAWARGLDYVDRAMVDQAAGEIFDVRNGVRPVWIKRSVQVVLGLMAALVLAVPVAKQLDLWPYARSLGGGVADPVATPQPVMAAGAAFQDVVEVLTGFPADIAIAWRELGSLWNIAAESGEPCQTGGTQQVQCYRASDISMLHVRQLGRPGILGLRADDGSIVYASLIAMDEQMATLRHASSDYRVSLSSLGRVWQGEFYTYWRPPAGYSSRLQLGSTGSFVDTLKVQLDALEGRPTTPQSQVVFNGVLRERVRAFQRAHGLKPDGEPGPMTLMQIERALGAIEPSLGNPS